MPTIAELQPVIRSFIYVVYLPTKVHNNGTQRDLTGSAQIINPGLLCTLLENIKGNIKEERRLIKPMTFRDWTNCSGFYNSNSPKINVT